MELELFIMQSKPLRDLAMEIMNYVSEVPNLSDADFIYWSRKADEYSFQAGGFAALRDLRLQEITILTEGLVNAFKKYGIEVDKDNIDSTIQSLESSDN
jgi:hypothetical protein